MDTIKVLSRLCDLIMVESNGDFNQVEECVDTINRDSSLDLFSIRNALRKRRSTIAKSAFSYFLEHIHSMSDIHFLDWTTHFAQNDDSQSKFLVRTGRYDLPMNPTLFQSAPFSSYVRPSNPGVYHAIKAFKAYLSGQKNLKTTVCYPILFINCEL